MSVSLDHAAIARRVPHAGAMCLLDRISAFDGERLTAYAISHRDADNPLRDSGVLSSVHAIEYAAQAMAVHGSMLADQDPNTPPRAGRLTHVRSADFLVPDLHAIEDDLKIDIVRLMGDENTVIYEFEITAQAQALARGKVGVMLVAHGRPSE